jgi:hypothetical protein
METGNTTERTKNVGSIAEMLMSFATTGIKPVCLNLKESLVKDTTKKKKKPMPEMSIKAINDAISKSQKTDLSQIQPVGGSKAKKSEKGEHQ